MDAPVLPLDERFHDLVDPYAKLHRLGDGCSWAEGPVWDPRQQALIWSDIPNDRMLQWSRDGGVQLFRKPSNFSNGNTLDREGRIVTCEHSPARVSRTETDGTVVALATRYLERRLNSPNDLVVKSDGSIWFTDPPYGILSEREGRPRESEIGANYVYRMGPDGEDLRAVAHDFDRPNGIAFSPDELTIYIADSGAPRHIRALDVHEDGTLTNSRVFAVLDAGVSDGFRVDTVGNVWTSAADGVHVLTPAGKLVGKIRIPEKVANCEFGGSNGSTLFITASTSLYAIEVKARKAGRPNRV